MRAVAFEELGAGFGVVAELLVQKKTVLLVAEPLQEIIADWHLVEVCVVRSQAFLVGAAAADEVGTDDDVSRVVEHLTAAVSVGEALPESSVDLTHGVGLLEAALRQQRDAFGLRQRQMISDLVAVVSLEASVLRRFVSQTADVDSRHLRVGAFALQSQSLARRVENEL